MSTPIVISDDEEEHKAPRPRASQTRMDARPAYLVQRQTGPPPRLIPCIENRRPTPLTGSINELIGLSNTSTTEKQVAGNMPSAPISVRASHSSNPLSSRKLTSSQREPPRKLAKEPLNFIDLTGEETSVKIRMDSNPPRATHAQHSSQSLHGQTRPESATEAALGHADRNNHRELTRRTHSSGCTVTPVFVEDAPAGSNVASVGDSIKEASIPPHHRKDELPKASENSLLLRPSVPRPTNANAVAKIMHPSASPHRVIGSKSGSPFRNPPAEKGRLENSRREQRRSVSVKGHRGSPLVNQSANHRRENGRREEHRPVPINGYHESLQNGKKADNENGAAKSHSPPRLKLNPPKSNASYQQRPAPASCTTAATENMRGIHQTKADSNLNSRMAGINHDKRSAFLSTQEAQTPVTESDSSDADMTMERSINQAYNMYNAEPQRSSQNQARILVQQNEQDIDSRTVKSQMPTSQQSEPMSASGSKVLGNQLSEGGETGDRCLPAKKISGAEMEALNPALESEQVSVVDSIKRRSSPTRSRPIEQSSAIRTIIEEPTFTVELQQAGISEQLPIQEPNTSSQRGSISPDLKLLEAIFKPLVAEMRTAQEYLVAGFLSRARKDVTEWPCAVLDQSMPHPFLAVSPAWDNESLPFGTRRIRMETKVANGRGKQSSLIDTQAVAFQSEAIKLPKYNSIVRLRSNVLTPNEKNLRYLPYFPAEEEKDGADALNHKRREELLEGFGNRIRFLPGERKCSEQADLWREHTEYFLEEVGCTCVDVMYYLLHDEDAEWKPQCQLSDEALSHWQNRETCCGACGTKFEGDQWDRLAETLSEQKPDEETLALAGLVCSVFSHTANFSIWHIVSTDTAVQSLLLRTEKKWASEQEPKKPKQQVLCMLCHMFDCPTHGAYLEDDHHDSSSPDESDQHRRKIGQQELETDHDSNSNSEDDFEGRHNIRQHVALPQRIDAEDGRHKCGFFCVDPLTPLSDVLGLRGNGEVQGEHNKNMAREVGDPAFENGEKCSETCFWDVPKRPQRSVTEIAHSEPHTRFVDWDQRDITLYQSMLAVCLRVRRGPCLMATMITRPCSVIFEEMLIDIHLVPHPVSEDGAEQLQPLTSTLTNGYKDRNYWFESSDTYDHHKRRPFVPCSHSGPCHRNPECTCWTDKVACEWICGCDRACSRRFQGCRCIARGAKVCFKDSNCDCFLLNRECDPWLCGKCGVFEVLDPVNRCDDSILKGRCKNAMIQRNIPKRTLKGPSEVHGWGLFAGTDIRLNDYIGEYKGEVISEEESNRRGLVYHYRGLEYLFRLNKEQEIDSSRAGNKMRFINNSERNNTINVYAQTMLCNGVQRIGLFARRNITAGEEMFFRYGYPESVTKKFWEKEDVYAGKRSRKGDVLQDDADTTAVKGKGVRASVVATKRKHKRRGGRRRVSKKVQTVLHKSGSKTRHAHFVDDIANDSLDLPPRLSKNKKRKRQSSPMIEESTFDLPELESQNPSLIPCEDPEAEEHILAAGPSSSSFGPPTEIADSDPDDDEYHEDDPSDSDEEESPSSSSAAASDLDLDLEISDYDGLGGNSAKSNRRRSSGTRRNLSSASAPTSASASASKQQPSKGYLQTAAARAASKESRRRKAEEKMRLRLRGIGSGGGNDDSLLTSATLLANDSTASMGLSTAIPTQSRTAKSGGGSSTSSRRKKEKAISNDSSHYGTKDSMDGDSNTSRPRTHYTGRKRGRPFGWKKGIHFK